MRCPSCNDEYEPQFTRCADCRVPLVSDDGSDDGSSGDSGDGSPGSDADHSVRARSRAGAASVPDAPREVRLGLFDPFVAGLVQARLERDEVTHNLVAHDDAAEILVDRGDRDALRAELAVNWEEIVADLDEDRLDALESDGPAPGWFDAPRGGHIDREGRLVVDADDGEQWESSRVLGPGLLVSGVAVGLLGWWLLESGALVTLGVVMVAIGLFSPR